MRKDEMKTAAKLNNFDAYAGPAMNQKIALMIAEGRDVINQQSIFYIF